MLWNRAKTPNGIIITLASPATDALGRSGMDGDIDNHWFERIGSALLVSIVKDATSYVRGRFLKGPEKALLKQPLREKILQIFSQKITPIFLQH